MSNSKTKSKSLGRSMLGSLRRRPTVTVIEAPVTQVYARRARIAFFVVATIVAILSGTVYSEQFHPIVGLFLGVLTGIVCGAVVGLLIWVWPFLRVLWHWAIEIVLGAGLVFGWNALASLHRPAVTLTVATALVGVPAVVGPLRRRVVAVAWCVIVRHRLRVCFKDVIRSGSRDGAANVPLILWARPTPAGERVWVWLRPGLALSDLDGRFEQMAVACWATEVRAVQEGTKAAYIRFDISRRDPLTGNVLSPLNDMVPDGTFDTGITRPVPTGGLNLSDLDDDDQVDEVPAPRNRRNGSTRSNGKNGSMPTNGADDVSAFI